MTQQTEHDAALCKTVASVTAALILAIERVDHESITVEIARLLNAITAYNRALAERPSDEPLRAAVERLSASP